MDQPPFPCKHRLCAGLPGVKKARFAARNCAAIKPRPHKSPPFFALSPSTLSPPHLPSHSAHQPQNVQLFAFSSLLPKILPKNDPFFCTILGAKHPLDPMLSSPNPVENSRNRQITKEKKFLSKLRALSSQGSMILLRWGNCGESAPPAQAFTERHGHWPCLSCLCALHD